jgi:glutaredoxin 2
MDLTGMKREGGEGIETVTISKEELKDIIQYYDKRSTKGMTSERTKKCREMFRKVFSPGKRILDVQGS